LSSHTKWIALLDTVIDGHSENPGLLLKFIDEPKIFPPSLLFLKNTS